MSGSVLLEPACRLVYLLHEEQSGEDYCMEVYDTVTGERIGMVHSDSEIYDSMDEVILSSPLGEYIIGHTHYCNCDWMDFGFFICP